MVLRVGFISTANIARKNRLAIKAATGIDVVAVSSRSLEKAQAWAKEWEVEKAYGSADELLADADIDAVYVPMPTGKRVPIVIAAAKAGKHILCEKPIAPSAEEASKMIHACQENGVVFMDGVMFMHNPRLSAMKAVIESGDFGHVKRVTSDFSFNGGAEFYASNIRGTEHGPALEPLGALGDLGWYNIRLAMFAFDWEVPTSVSAVAHRIKDGMPMEISSVLSFGEGKSSTFTNSYEAAFRQYAAIVGTKQTIEITDFCLSGPTDTACTFRVFKQHGLTKYDLLPTKEIVDTEVNYPANQEVRMWETFAELCRTRDGEKLQFYAKVALDTQRVMDAIMESMAKEGAAVSVTRKRKASEM